MKYYVYPLLFIVALSVSSVGEAVAGDKPKSKREIATPSSDTKTQQSLNKIGLVVELKGNEKLVLKGGDYIVRQPNGVVQFVWESGPVKRTFPQGKIYKKPNGKVFILTKTEKVAVGRYKGIETIKPGKDSPAADAETARPVISPGGIGQVRERPGAREQQLLDVPEGIVHRGNTLEAKSGYEFEETSPNEGNIVYMMSPGVTQITGKYACQCCTTSKGKTTCVSAGCKTSSTGTILVCGTTTCSVTCALSVTTTGLHGNRLAPQ